MIEQALSFEVHDKNVADGAVLGLAGQVLMLEVLGRNVDDDDVLVGVPQVPPSEVPDKNVVDGAALAGQEQVLMLEVLGRNVDDDDVLVGVPRVPPSEVLGTNFGYYADLAGQEQVLMLEVLGMNAAADVVHYCTLVGPFVAVWLERVPSSVQTGPGLGLALVQASTRDHH